MVELGVDGAFGRTVAGVPGVAADVQDGETLGRVGFQDALDKTLAVLGEEVREQELAMDDLLIEIGGVLVIEGEVATDEGEEDDASAPEVNHEGIVLLALDHFGGGIAGGPAGCLEVLVVVGVVLVGETEVYYL